MADTRPKKRKTCHDGETEEPKVKISSYLV